MLYKTIVLELLQQRPQMHERLCKDHQLLSTLSIYAKELKASHETWKELLAEQKPETDPSQISSKAMEMALKELEDRLPAASPRDENEIFSLDAAMAYLRRHTSRG